MNEHSAQDYLRRNSALRDVLPGTNFRSLSRGEIALDDIRDALGTDGLLATAAAFVDDESWAAVVKAVQLLRPVRRDQLEFDYGWEHYDDPVFVGGQS